MNCLHLALHVLTPVAAGAAAACVGIRHILPLGIPPLFKAPLLLGLAIAASAVSQYLHDFPVFP